MKNLSKILIVVILLGAGVQNVSADMCVDLKNAKESQLKRLEIAKAKIFEQDENSTKAIQEKRFKKVVSIEKKTSSRVNDLKIILSDLELIDNKSEDVSTRVKDLSEKIASYDEKTKKSLDDFSLGLEKILDDKSKGAKNTVNQYEISVAQLYDDSIAECIKNGTHDTATFNENLKQLQKRVTDAEKNSKRILKGIDALYATLALELDESDVSLNLVLKSIQNTLLLDPNLNLKPLSLFRLLKIL